MLTVNGLEVRYGDLAALRGVSLEVKQGEIVSIVGPNGAGKSTLLLTIAGELAPFRGAIEFEGQQLKGVPPDRLVRMGISLVPEGRRIFSSLSVEENLLLATFIRPDRQEAREHLQGIFEHFPALRERLHSPGGRLSGGEQQQLAIARALLTKPRLMLVDEPSLGLAPKMASVVYNVLTKLNSEGLSILLIEQSADRALQLANRIYVLRSGAVQLSGVSDDLRGTRAVQDAYFGFAE